MIKLNGRCVTEMIAAQYEDPNLGLLMPIGFTIGFLLGMVFIWLGR